MDWRDYLTGRRVREDLYDTFPPDKRDDYQPALLNSGSVLAAARVGARLLQIIAKRGGSRIDASALERLITILDDSLPDSARPHCDDEAARVLDWLETAEQLPPDERDHSTLPPELDLMLAADIESRISVAQFAIEEGHNLELEYFDESNNTWPRYRCRPVEVTEDDLDGEEADLSPVLIVERQGEELELPVKNIRWLMPVTRQPREGQPSMREQLGRVLDFPTGDVEGESDADNDRTDRPTED